MSKQRMRGCFLTLPAIIWLLYYIGFPPYPQDMIDFFKFLGGCVIFVMAYFGIIMAVEG